MALLNQSVIGNEIGQKVVNQMQGSGTPNYTFVPQTGAINSMFGTSSQTATQAPQYSLGTDAYGLRGADQSVLDRYVQEGKLKLYQSQMGDYAEDPMQDQLRNVYNFALQDGRHQAIRIGEDGRAVVSDPYKPTGDRNMILAALAMGGMGAISSAGMAGAGSAAGTSGANAVAGHGAIAGGSAGAGSAAAGVGAASQIPGGGNAPVTEAPTGPAAAPNLSQLPDQAGGIGSSVQSILSAIGSGLVDPRNLPALLGTLAQLYQSNTSGDLLRQSYYEDRAQQRAALDKLNESYSNPEGFLNGPEYQAAQRVIHNQLQRADAAAGNLANDAQRQKLMQDHAFAALENHRSGLRQNAQLVNPNINQYVQGTQMRSDILNPVMTEIGRRTTPQPQVSVGEDGRMKVSWS